MIGALSLFIRGKKYFPLHQHHQSARESAGWAYTLLQTTPLQDFGAEKKGGGVFTPGWAYNPNFTVLLHDSVHQSFQPCKRVLNSCYAKANMSTGKICMFESFDAQNHEQAQ